MKGMKAQHNPKTIVVVRVVMVAVSRSGVILIVVGRAAPQHLLRQPDGAMPWKQLYLRL
jgi:hypothetical protein